MRACAIASLFASLLGTSACRDREDATAIALPTTVSAPPTVVVRPSDHARARLTVHHAHELRDVDLSAIERLDLAMSDVDQVGHLEELDPSTTCEDLDLVALAERLPRLSDLRISGCPHAIQAGLSAFGGRIASLTLADITLDAVTIGNLQALTSLRSLTLTRVTASPDRLDPLHRLPIERVVLQNLQKDSPVAAILALWPKTLREIVLEGDWAGHDAMTSLNKAEALQRIELRGTRVTNYSLHQIKPLANLSDLTFEGPTFNDSTPQYIRELPVTRFACNCPRLGDGGLRALRHSAGLETLELRDTAVTIAGLEPLTKLEKLQAIVLLDRDLGATGFATLAALPKLRRLELSGPIENPRMPGLGSLPNLQVLRLAHPELDDRVATELASLHRLQRLDLSGTRISDVGLSQLAELAALRELDLGKTRVTNRGLSHLSRLTKLEVLRLDHTDVIDAGIAAFAHHPALRELSLDGTLVTDACIDTLLTMPALERLGLSGTVISHAGLTRLRAHPQLQALDISNIRG